MRRVLGMVAVMAALSVRLLFAQEGSVAQVLSAKSQGGSIEVELRIVKGAFFSNSEIDVLRPSGKSTASIVFLNNVDMALAGDTLKAKITPKSPVDVSGALIGEQGKFADHAAAQRLVTSSGPKGAPAAPRATPAPAATAAPAAATATGVRGCAFTPAELKAALNLDVKEGTEQPALPFTGGRRLGCQYSARTLTGPSVRVSLTVMDDPKQANTDGYFKMMAGRMEPVPNDPDKAVWQGNQGDLTEAVLHYARQGILVEVRAGLGPKHPQFASVKQGLVKLRRLP